MARIETIEDLKEFLFAVDNANFDMIEYWDSLGVSEIVLKRLIASADAAYNDPRGEPWAILLGVLTTGARLALKSDTLDEKAAVV